MSISCQYSSSLIMMLDQTTHPTSIVPSVQDHLLGRQTVLDHYIHTGVWANTHQLVLKLSCFLHYIHKAKIEIYATISKIRPHEDARCFSFVMGQNYFVLEACQNYTSQPSCMQYKNISSKNKFLRNVLF